LQIVIVEKQIQVTLVRDNVVNNGRLFMCPATLEQCATAFVLAPVSIPKQHTAAQLLPLLGLV
jgi:hypothetical protein